MAAANERPTNVRFLVLALTTLVAVLLYLDRFCLGVAERYVKEDLGVSDAQMAIILSSFFWAYALAQVPSGWLSDRFGARMMLAIYLAVWSAFTGLLGLATTVFMLIFLRAGVGLFEAGAYPTAAGLISRWMPYHRRGLSSGIVSIGGRIGGTVAPVLTAYLMVAFVPVSHSSLLEEKDLLDVSSLVKYLDDAGTTPSDKLGRLIKGYFPGEAQEAVERAPSLDLNATDPHLKKLLVQNLNLVLQRRELIHRVEAAEFQLPAEARSLAQPSEEPRSAQEIQRRNRLLLETAFPEAIRKIYGSGWRPVMLVYGIVGVLVALVFWWYFRNGPRQHPGCNAAEAALIEGENFTPADPRKRQPLPFAALLKSTSLWIASLVQVLTNFAWIFLLTWFPRYLIDEKRVSLVEAGWMTSLPILVGMTGMFLGGWLTDFITARMGRRLGRTLALGISRFIVAAAFFTCLVLHAQGSSAWAVTIALCLVAFATDLGTPSLWGYSLDVGGKHVGSVLGWSNMYGNLGAAVSPIILNWVIEVYDWEGLFSTCAVTMVAAGIFSFGIDATKVVVPEENKV